jgi:hypothetical protein
MRRFVVSQERLRELMLAGLFGLSVCGLLFGKYLETQSQKVDEVIANGRAQKEKLAVLQDRVREVQETLSHWKDLRERIRASLPQGSNEPSNVGTKERSYMTY